MSIEARLTRTGPDGYRIITGAKGVADIVVDIAGVSAEDKSNEHIGGRLLLSACLSCFTNTLFNDLTKAGGTVNSIEARAATEKAKDSSLRTKYDNIAIEVDVDVDGLDDAAFESVRSTLLRGSLVTYSLDEGIEMDYEINRI